MSSKSVTLLGLTVAAAGLLPPQPAGVVGVGPAIARGVGAGAPVPTVPYRKSEIEINFFKMLFFDNSHAG